MDLLSVRVGEAPLARDRVRLIGEVAYDDRPGRAEQYWFDFPERCAGSLSVSGNPWLACLLPLAVTREEPLRLDIFNTLTNVTADMSAAAILSRRDRIEASARTPISATAGSEPSSP